MKTYYICADALSKLWNAKGHLKSIVQSEITRNSIPFSSVRASKIFGIVKNTNDNQQDIKNYIHQITKVKKFPVKNIYLLAIFINEQLTGNLTPQSKIGGKLKKLIFSLLPPKQHIPETSSNQNYQQKNTQLRLLADRITVEEFQAELAHVSWKQNENIKEIIKEDSLIPGIINIPCHMKKTLIESLEIANRDDMILQGKSSALPAQFLMRKIMHKILRKKFDIIDCCASPGNKTIQLAEQLGRNGRVFAFEMNQKRFKILKERIGLQQQKNIEIENTDFLSVNPNDIKYGNVKQILVDPSCSSSGMKSNPEIDWKTLQEQRHSQLDTCLEIQSKLSKKEKKRIQKLSQFQKRILCHSMLFPNVKKISQSTCSIFQKENEDVVYNAISINRNWNISNIGENHNLFEQGFPIKTQGKQLNATKKCIRTNPFNEDLDGFFVSILKRTK